MANKKPVNRDNPKNIYCAHCKHWGEHNLVLQEICTNPNSEHYQNQRNYWCRCKAFEWEDKEDGK